MLRGEAIAWIYTLISLDAIFMMEQDLMSTSHQPISYRDGLRDDPHARVRFSVLQRNVI